MKFDNIGNIKEYILSKVSEEQIFSHYLHISTSDITESINYGCKVKNTQRNDSNASVQFKFNGRKVKMLDYGSRVYNGDCFHIVGLCLFKDCNKPKDFMYILNHIIESMIDKNIQYIHTEKQISKKNKQFQIEIEPRRLSGFDYNYFKQYLIRAETIDKSNVNVVDNYHLNGELNFYRYNQTDPCYGYFIDNLPTSLWKLYFPLRNKNKLKFITNNLAPIEGFRFLKPNKNLILTKSNKDKLLLKQVVNDLNIRNTEVGNVSSESTIIFDDDLVNWLNKRYDKVFTLFDTDEAGLDATNYCIAKYNYTPFLFLSGVAELTKKDLTDTAKVTDYKYILNTILTNYNKIYER